jgi:predicted metal-dependent phosphoesterase TrpH
MLKIDLHLHAKNDPLDDKAIKYSAEQLIDYMSKLGYDVIALTPHLYNNYDKKLIKYAEKKGVLLIFGTELKLNNKHVLVYNADNEKLKHVKDISDLGKIKDKNSLIVAPHPYFIFQSLGKELERNIDLFDAIELSHFYTKNINRNKKAIELAKKTGKPLVGSSDCHNFKQVGHTYTLVDAKKDTRSVLSAIKKGNVVVKTKPIKFGKLFSIFIVNSTNGLKTIHSRRKAKGY